MLAFMVTDVLTGRIIMELPGAVASGSITAGIGWTEDFSVDLPINDRLNEGWVAATEPGRTALACVDTRTNIPLIAGPITKRSIGNGAMVKVQAMSYENWLKRLIVPTGEVRKELCDLAEYLGLGLLTQYAHGEVVKKTTGIHATRLYEPDKAVTRLDALWDLMRSEPIEFAIFYRFDEQSCLVPRVVIQQRIGRDVPKSGAPNFVMGPSEWSADLDYSNVANIVTAYGTRQVETQTKDKEGTVTTATTEERITYTARAQDLLDAGFLPLEESFQPESSATSMEVLKRAAQRRLKEARLGAETVSIKTLLDHLVIGVDVDRGDYFVADLVNPDAPEISRTVQARMVGYTIEVSNNELTYISPILQEASPIN